MIWCTAGVFGVKTEGGVAKISLDAWILPWILIQASSPLISAMPQKRKYLATWAQNKGCKRGTETSTIYWTRLGGRKQLQMPVMRLYDFISSIKNCSFLLIQMETEDKEGELRADSGFDMSRGLSAHFEYHWHSEGNSSRSCIQIRTKFCRNVENDTMKRFY